MKKLAAVLATSLLFSAAAMAQNDIWQNIGFGVSSYPEANGNTTEGYLSYRFTPTWSSAVRVKIVNLSVSEKGTLVSEDSLIETRDRIMEAFIFPAELKIAPAGFPLYLSAGLYLSSIGANQTGFFNIETVNPIDFPDESDYFIEQNEDVGMHSFNLINDNLSYGPVISIGTTFSLPVLELYAEATVVPLFWFNNKGEATTTPLIPTKGSYSYSNMGFPYIAVKLQPTILDFISPDIIYEYQNQPIKDITFDIWPDPNEWSSVIGEISAHTLTLRGNVRLPILKNGYAEIGYGRIITWTIPKGEEAIVDNRGTFKLTFNIEK